jgi:pre-rRNA-processing protein TSR3
LSCVEAFAATLAIVGLQEFGSILLNKFKWGHGFYTLNESLLHAYANCDSAEALLECDNRFRSGQDQSFDDDMPNRDMPPSESSSDEDSNDEIDSEAKNLQLPSIAKLSLTTTEA